MKKILCVITLAILPSLAFCQYFVLTPEGMRNEVALEQDYVVMEFPGKAQQELYDQTHDFIVAKFNSAKDVLSESAPNVMSVGALMGFKFDGGGAYNYAGRMNYKFVLQFKDGKIRVSYENLGFYFPPQSMHPKFSIDLVSKGMSVAGIFSKKGKCRAPKSKAEIEQQVNDIVSKLKDYMSGNHNDNW